MPYVSNTLAEGPKVTSIIQRDKTFQDTRKEIAEKIDVDFQLIKDTVSFLEKHRPVYNFGLSWSAEEFAARGGHTVLSVKSEMDQQTQWANEIERIRQQYDAGIFQAETRTLKGSLQPVTRQTLSDMKIHLLRMFQEKASSVQIEYKSKIDQLNDDPQALPAFAKHVEVSREIVSKREEMLAKAQEVCNCKYTER
jgi:hypothetical protein